MTAADPGAGEVVRGQLWVKGEAVDGFSLRGLPDQLGQTDTLVWADIESPSEQTLRSLARLLDINEYALEDTVSANERVKLVDYRHFVFLTVYSVHVDADSLAMHRVSVIISQNVLITVRPRPGFDIDEVQRRWADSEDQRYGIGALVHGLLDVVVDSHFDAVQTLDDHIEDLETLLFSDDKNPPKSVQQRTYRLRKTLVALRRVVLPMREVIGGIQRRRYANHAPPELDPNFSDLYDHALRAAEWTESLRDMVTTVFETTMSLADARLNMVMKKLTSWAAIIAVPTAITGFYGQNVPFPGFSHTVGFIVSSVLIVVAVTALYVGFRRRDWL